MAVNTFKNTFRPSVEVGKEKLVDLLNASKQVLKEYGDKAVEAFSKFPNKMDFTTAAFTGLMGLQFAGLAALSLHGGIPADTAVAGAVTFAAGSLFLEGGSGVLFNEWYRNSFGKSKSETK